MILDPTPRTFHLSAADRAGPGSGGVVGADAAAGFSFTVKRRSAALRPRCLAAPLPRCRRRGGAPARRLRSPLAGRGPRRARGHHCLFPCESLLNQQLLSAMSRKHFVLFCFLPSSSLKRERVKAKKKKTQQARSMELTISGGKTKGKKKKNSPFPHSLQKNTPKSTQWRSPSSARAPSSSPRRPSLPRRRSRPRSRTATTAAAPRRCGPRSRACSTAGSPSRGFSSPSCATCSRARTTRCRSCCCCTW